MITQFSVSPQLQQFLQGVPSKKLVNVLWDKTFPVGDLPTFPFNPGSTHRSILFSKFTPTLEATPTYEFEIFIMNTDGSGPEQVTGPRGL